MDDVKLLIDSGSSEISLQSITGKYEYEHPSKNKINEKSDLGLWLDALIGNPFRITHKWQYDWMKGFRIFHGSIHIVMVVLLTMVLVISANARSAYQNYVLLNTLSFHSIFLQDWSKVDDLPLDPQSNSYTIYTKQGLLDNLNYATFQFFNFGNISLSGFAERGEYINLTTSYYTKVDYEPSNNTYAVDYTIISSSTNVSLSDVIDKSQCNSSEKIECYNIQKFLDSRGMPLDTSRMTFLQMEMRFHGLRIKKQYSDWLKPVGGVQCAAFVVRINFDNKDKDSKIDVKLRAFMDDERCEGQIDRAARRKEEKKRSHQDRLIQTVIVLSALSWAGTLFLAVVRIFTCQKIAKIFERKLSAAEYFEFGPMRLSFNFISDGLSAAGTILRLCLNDGHVADHNKTFFSDIAGILIGVGCLTHWVGLLAYLRFYPSFYIIIKTLRLSAAALMRALVSIMFWFIGYTLCGWVAFSPHSPEYKSFFKTMDTLCAMGFGDGIHMSLETISLESDPEPIYYFSRFYVYSFNITFVMLISNLFIAIVTACYEVIKKWEEDGFPKTPLEEFIESEVRKNELLQYEGNRVADGADIQDGSYESNESKKSEVDDYFLACFSPIHECLGFCAFCKRRNRFIQEADKFNHVENGSGIVPPRISLPV